MNMMDVRSTGDYVVRAAAPTEYVVGLMFSEDRRRVVLIKKTHGPANMAGKWNGVGGHVEVGENPYDSMVREFKEETGAQTATSQWRRFLVLSGANFVVHFFHAFDDRSVKSARTAEEELVGAHSLSILPENLTPNLRWIIPMALWHQDDHVERYEVIEAEVLRSSAATNTKETE